MTCRSGRADGERSGGVAGAEAAAGLQFGGEERGGGEGQQRWAGVSYACWTIRRNAETWQSAQRVFLKDASGWRLFSPAASRHWTAVVSLVNLRILSNLPHMNTLISPVTRRSFLHRGSAGVAAAALASSFPHIVNAQAAKAIKIGIVGCGGRGSGALTDAMNADPNVVLTAMGDIAADQIEKSFKNISAAKPDQVKVDERTSSSASTRSTRCSPSDIDIVLLTTPPGFRPAHLHKAINAGKHVFCEKPLGVDAPAIRHALEAVKKAKEKNLAIQTGFCWRYNFAERATWKKLHDGAIGDIRCYYGTYLTNTPWVKARAGGLDRPRVAAPQLDVFHLAQRRSSRRAGRAHRGQDELGLQRRAAR